MDLKNIEDEAKTNEGIQSACPKLHLSWIMEILSSLHITKGAVNFIMFWSIQWGNKPHKHS